MKWYQRIFGFLGRKIGEPAPPAPVPMAPPATIPVPQGPISVPPVSPPVAAPPAPPAPVSAPPAPALAPIEQMSDLITRRPAGPGPLLTSGEPNDPGFYAQPARPNPINPAMVYPAEPFGRAPNGSGAPFASMAERAAYFRALAVRDSNEAQTETWDQVNARLGKPPPSAPPPETAPPTLPPGEEPL